jgi:hypothetical protein
VRRRLAALSVSVALAVGCAPSRPLVPPPYPLPAARVETRDGIRGLGSSFLRMREGIREARLEGDAYRRGYDRGRLAYDEILSVERDLRGMLERFLPSAFKRLLLQKVVAVHLRASIPGIPAEHLEEIVGLSDALSPDPFREQWNPFARYLALHALHDFSQRYADDTPLAAACTGFAASGPATADGHTWMARNFDFEGGDRLDREKIVAYVVPKDGIPYLSVTFAGLTGVTSGFNREGIGIFVNAWSAGETSSSGEPATLVAADVLERARNLAEAVGILQKAVVFVSDIYVVADGKTGELAVVEKTPTRSAVRRADNRILAANHPETPDFAGARLAASSTSLYRRERLEELLARQGPLDAKSAVRVLRDRRGKGDRDLSPGNRNAVNALISSHSVIFDLTARRAWVAQEPHGLGRFVAYSLDLGIGADPADPRFQALASEGLPPDPWLTGGGYANYVASRRLLAEADLALTGKRPALAFAKAQEALRRAPGSAEALALSAEALATTGDREGAGRLMAAALERDPSPPPFARSLEEFRAALAAGRPPPRRPAYPVRVTEGETVGSR